MVCVHFCFFHVWVSVWLCGSVSEGACERERECVCACLFVWENVCVCVYVGERKKQCVHFCVCVCRVIVGVRVRQNVCVRVWKRERVAGCLRERMCVCRCVWVRECCVCRCVCVCEYERENVCACLRSGSRFCSLVREVPWPWQSSSGQVFPSMKHSFSISTECGLSPLSCPDLHAPTIKTCHSRHVRSW
jgi:hypothetical protein